MKNVNLTELTLRNFKKAKELSIQFSKNTQINGANGTGKTTVFDAYCWLLYGKNSINQSDFSIKTLDNSNNIIHKLEHEVEGVFDVDGTKLVFKRTYCEKWTTKRGQSDEELTGHETKYFVDEVPVSKSEYEIKVKGMIEEGISKIISNPDYFNNQLNWKERRILLSRMAGEVSDNNVLDSKSWSIEMSELVSLIDSGANLVDEKKKTNAQKKKIKGELDLIPSRIDEVDRMKPETQDFGELAIEKDSIEKELEKVNEQIDDKNKATQKQREDISQLKTDKFNKEERLRTLEREQKLNDNRDGEILTAFSKEKDELFKLKQEDAQISTSIAANELRIEALSQTRVELLSQHKEIKEKEVAQVTEEDTACPTCKRELDNASELSENLKRNHNEAKALSLKDNETKGKANAESIKTLEDKNKELNESRTPVLIETVEKAVSTISESLDKPKAELKPTSEMIELKKEIETFVIPEITPVNADELFVKRTELNEQIDELKSKLNTQQLIIQSDQRIEELNEQKRTMSQEIADLEKIEFQIDAFNKAKINLVEGRINDKFSIVKFKMFEEQLNGGESETCICLVDGVPFNDLNTASQINASLDIINALQYHYEIFAPVFIDHRESVSILQPTECQTISLKVDETAPELQILNV